MDAPNLRTADDPLLPHYIRTAAKKAQATFVAILPGGYQLLTAAEAVEYARNVGWLSC